MQKEKHGQQPMQKESMGNNQCGDLSTAHHKNKGVMFRSR